MLLQKTARSLRPETTLVALLVPLLLAACSLSPQPGSGIALLQSLEVAWQQLQAGPVDLSDTCHKPEVARIQLFAEPTVVGLSDEQRATLNDAVNDLMSACGQDFLLQNGDIQQAAGDPLVDQARERWQTGLQIDLGVACGDLQRASQALGTAQPVCS